MENLASMPAKLGIFQLLSKDHPDEKLSQAPGCKNTRFCRFLFRISTLHFSSHSKLMTGSHLIVVDARQFYPFLAQFTNLPIVLAALPGLPSMFLKACAA